MAKSTHHSYLQAARDALVCNPESYAKPAIELRAQIDKIVCDMQVIDENAVGREMTDQERREIESLRIEMHRCRIVYDIILSRGI
jgi:hypothetical protein